MKAARKRHASNNNCVKGLGRWTHGGGVNMQEGEKIEKVHCTKRAIKGSRRKNWSCRAGVNQHHRNVAYSATSRSKKESRGGKISEGNIVFNIREGELGGVKV